MNTCGLCLQSRELKESHILPAFVIRWLKETSGTGFIRFGQEPNRRVQDGMKLKLLCGDCEQHIAKYEQSFAENLFHPLTSEHQSPFYPRCYGEWMALFAASVSWRARFTRFTLHFTWAHPGISRSSFSEYSAKHQPVLRPIYWHGYCPWT